MGDLINIHGKDVTPLEYNGKRVMTFRMVDDIHNKPDGSARKRFADNKRRFIDGEDFYTVKPADIYEESVLRTYKNQNIKIALLTESGYLLLVKSFNDDFAWSIQRILIKSYFKTIEHKQLLPQTFSEALRLLADEVERNQLLENKIQEDKPLLEFAENISRSEGTLTVGDFAKILCKRDFDIGPNRLFRLMRDKDCLNLLITTQKPFQHALDNKWLEVEEFSFKDKNEVERISKKVLITGKGQKYIERKLRKFTEDSLAREKFFQKHPST